MRKAAVIVAAAAMLLTVTACWDMTEINSQGYIIGLGMDSAEQEGEYLFTFQRAVPYGTGVSSEGQSVQCENITVSAPSLAQAVRQLQLASAAEFSFVHLSCVIIGSQLAHDGFEPLLEYLMQQTDVRRQCLVAVASGTAASLLNAAPAASPGSSGTAALLEVPDSSRSRSMTMTLSSISSAVLTGRGYFLYEIGPISEMTLSAPGTSGSDAPAGIAGAYIFSPDELAGRLDAGQADMLRLFAPQQNDGMISAVHESGRTVYFWIDRSQCRIFCTADSDRLEYTVDVAVWCSIADAAGIPTGDISSGMIEQAISERLGELTALSRQKLGPAFLGLEDAARRSDPRWYREHREDFGRIFGNSLITVSVSCQLERTGVIK